MNRDMYVISSAFIIIILFLSINIYTETKYDWDQYVKWEEIYITTPEKIANTSLYKYMIETPFGRENLTYDSNSAGVVGNFTRIDNTLLFSHMSITLIDINERYLKALMIPSDLPQNTYCLFNVYVNLEDNYQYNIYSDEENFTWDNIFSSKQRFIFGLNFRSAGTHNISVEIHTADNDYNLEWVVNVRG